MMKMSWLATIAFALPLFVGAARADECADPPNQLAMNECGGKAFREADRKLNEAYGQIVNRLRQDAATRKQLVGAQRAWVAFRDAECAFKSSSGEGGSIHPLLLTTCWKTLTDNRLKDLQNYLHCQEGDLSCPVPMAD